MGEAARASVPEGDVLFLSTRDVTEREGTHFPPSPRYAQHLPPLGEKNEGATIRECARKRENTGARGQGRGALL